MSKKFAKYRMQVYAKPALKDNACAFMNIGESIQYLAMEQILKEIGVEEKDTIDITADEVRNYHGDTLYLPGKFILNDREINNILPFPKGIKPIFVSSVMLKNEVVKPELIEYLKHNEPIGCRDEQARNMLREYGIEAYLMGCFTMCISHRENIPLNGKVFLVDVSENLEKYIPENLRRDAIKISHAIPVNTTVMNREEDEKLNLYAKTLLEQYKNEAKLVITSRLHAAAPCLAMGIPVILASDNIDFRYSWIDKFIPIYTLDEYDNIDWNPKPVNTDIVKNLITTYLKKYKNNDTTYIQELKKLDEYYIDRKRTDYYGYFKKRIISACNKYMDGKFKYVIWGAGLHSGYAYDIIKELYPKAELVAVTDKYERGIRFGKDIICGDSLNAKTYFDIAFITTKPGTPEGINKMEEIFGEKAKEHYLVITSQQKS